MKNFENLTAEERQKEIEVFKTFAKKNGLQHLKLLLEELKKRGDYFKTKLCEQAVNQFEFDLNLNNK